MARPSTDIADRKKILADHAEKNRKAAEREAERQAALRDTTDQLAGDSMQRPGHAEDRARESSGQAATGAGIPPRGSKVATDKAAKAENLEGLTSAALQNLAEAKGITVTLTDGKKGKPRRSDYIAALSA